MEEGKKEREERKEKVLHNRSESTGSRRFSSYSSERRRPSGRVRSRR